MYAATSINTNRIRVSMEDGHIFATFGHWDVRLTMTVTEAMDLASALMAQVALDSDVEPPMEAWEEEWVNR